MYKLIALKLVFILFTSTLSGIFSTKDAHAKGQSTCENGECIEGLVNKLEQLTSLFQKECLPSGGVKSSGIEKYYEENGLSESCWKIITEINHLEDQLQKYQTQLQTKLGCESGDCKLPRQEESLNSQLTAITKVEQALSCTEPKKKEIKNQCGSDLNCVLMSSAFSLGGYVAEMLVPERFKPKNCNLFEDNCVTQLASGFLKSVFTFFESSWDLLKMAGKAAGKKIGEFWDWVTGAEDHSSTSQLALAKASEDPGVFDMLLKDFPGTMKNIFGAFVSSLKEWFKSDVFCSKWSGHPHFSKCLEPMVSFDCLSCKTMVNGVCSLTGTLIAEIVPSFLTGGLVTAAKHGANGAAKIAKLFKVSSTGMKLLKDTKVAKAAVRASSKIDEALKISKGLRVAKIAIESALKTISKYLLSPVRKAVKQSFSVLNGLAKSTSLYVANTKAGRVLVFGGRALKTTGKIILYPIENSLTVYAYRAGERTFEKLFKLGAPKLATKTAVAGALIKHDDSIEKVLIKLEETRGMSGKSSDLIKLEEELVSSLGPNRKKVLREALDNNHVEFDDIIKDLYPELKYGEYAKSLDTEKILLAEKELRLEIEVIQDVALRKKLLERFDKHVRHGNSRASVIADSSPTYQEIIKNSQLDSKERFEETLKLIDRKSISPEEKKALAITLEKAHLTGSDHGVFEYSFVELRQKYDILVSGGFSKSEADLLIRTGLAGRPPVRKIVTPGETLFSGFAEDLLDQKYLDKRDELLKLIRQKTPEEQNIIIRQFANLFNRKISDAEKIIDNLESLYFIDYSHSVESFDSILQLGKTLDKTDIALKYDQKAFDNFKEARKFLLETRPEISKETLLEVHKKMMRYGVENVPAQDLGKIRSGHWYGNVPSSYPIDDLIKKEILENPYLTWVQSGTRDGKFYGQIQYPNVDFVKKEGLDLIRKNHEKLVIEIEEYQSLPRLINEKEAAFIKLPLDNKDEARKLNDEIKALKLRHQALTENKFEMTQKLVDAMVDDLMDWFTRERTLIGEINTPEKLDEYVNLVSKFQRDLVSIHPLANGNGRSTREFALSYALMKEGFPPPRIIDPDADIYRSQEEWRKIIKHGILSSDFLVDDMIERLKFGLPIENSVDLITPYSRPPMKMELKGVKKVNEMDGVEYIDPRFYREVVKRMTASDKKLLAEMSDNPVGAWDKINKKVEEIYGKNNLYYNHAKNGIERVSLTFVDDDFIKLYGRPSFDNKELFDFKMKTWYSEDITWRGLASKYAEKSEDEIIQMFSELTSHNASNAVLKKISGSGTPETIRKAAIEDFEKYNTHLFAGENDNRLVQMAIDHSETGPQYAISYGYSTSKNRDVGKAFAMGAMVVGEYGAHKAPELQALLKSRVLVGARRANKDIDLGRLKQMREEFSYKYGRQQEVMGIGASDPDAITIVQTIDAKGEVIYSYLRNKNNPKEIFVVKGNIDPDAIPEADQLVKTITLKSN